MDGVAINSSEGCIFGFLRFANYKPSYCNSSQLAFPFLMAQSTESRHFYAETLPALVESLVGLTNGGVEAACVDFSESSRRYNVGIDIDFVICCDMKCLKLLLNRQDGNVLRGCMFCSVQTSGKGKKGNRRTNRQAFTDELIIRKSDAWVRLWERNKEQYPTQQQFERSDISKNWSRNNMSFSGKYSLTHVRVDQYMFCNLHLHLRITSILFSVITGLVVDKVQHKGIDRLSGFIDALDEVCLGHFGDRVLRRLCGKEDEKQNNSGRGGSKPRVRFNSAYGEGTTDMSENPVVRAIREAFKVLEVVVLIKEILFITYLFFIFFSMHLRHTKQSSLLVAMLTVWRMGTGFY